MGKFKSKLAISLAAFIAVLSSSFIGPAAPAQAADQSLDVYGFTVTWSDTMYFPTGCSNFSFRYQNNTGMKLLQVGFILTDPWGEKVADNSLIGAPSGGSGTWNEQICKSSLKNGLGPYTIKVFVEDYDTYGGNTREKKSTLRFTARPGVDTPAPSWPMPPTTSATDSLDVYGFKVSWDRTMYVPDGCSNYEFRYQNNIGYNLLQVGFILTNQYGDKVADNSLIGAPSGGYGTWNEQICRSSINGVLGPYTLKVFIEDYSSRGGSTREKSTNLYFSARPLPALTSTPTPVINGDVKVGSTLSVATGNWDVGASLSVAWFKNGTQVSSSSTYTIAVGDLGSTIVAKVTGSKTGYSATTVSSSSVGPVAAGSLKNTGPVTISGDLKIGSVLTGNVGSWDAGTALSYEWLKNGNVVSTGTSYTVTDGDVGSTFVFRVTGTLQGYSTSVSSSANSGVVPPPEFTTWSVPKVTGTAVVGKTLSLNIGLWDAGTNFNVQWLRSGAPISGAKGKTYKVTAKDKGKVLSVRVEASNSAFLAKTVNSAPTAKVK